MGIAFTAILGITFIVMLVCWIKVLIALFRNAGVGLGILGILCNLFAFIWGWVKSSELKLKGTMIAWTLCIVVSTVVWFMAAASLVNNPEFKKALEDAQRQAREQQAQQQAAPAPAPAPAPNN